MSLRLTKLFTRGATLRYHVSGDPVTRVASSPREASSMHLPRYRLRTLLIAVAVAALGMGTIVGLARRRESHLRQAAHHRKLSNAARLYAMSIERRYLQWGPAEPERAEMAAYERRGDY